MSRDWQKDMELIEQYEHAKTLVHGWNPQAHGQDVPKEPVEEALKYWLLFAKEEQEKRMEQEMINDDLKKELAAEKGRADKLEAELEFWRNEGTATKVQLIQAEAREKKLREAVEKSLNIYHDDGPNDEEALEAIRDELEAILEYLYSEKEE